jgi:hypothetical protein
MLPSTTAAVHAEFERILSQYKEVDLLARLLSLNRGDIDFGGYDRELTPLNNYVRASPIEVTDEAITAHLLDGRTISVPLVWSWRLVAGTPQQRQNYQIIGGGEGVHWPDVDEDLSVRGMLDGVPARPPKPATKQS